MAIPELLQINPAVSIEAWGTSAVLLKSEIDTHSRLGKIYGDLLSKLEWPVKSSELIAGLSDSYSDSQIDAAISDLLGIGAIGAPVRGPSRAQAAYNSLLPCPQGESRIAVRYLAEHGEGLLHQVLGSYGLRVDPEAARAIVGTDDYLRPDIALATRQYPEWLLTKPVGRKIWIGPLFRSGQSACWECMVACMRPHRWQTALFMDRCVGIPLEPSLACHPASLLVAAGLVSTAAAVWISAGEHPDLEDRILSIDLRTLRQTSHRIRRQPQCSECGTRSLFPGCSLEELVSPLTGIVSATETTSQPVGGLYHSRAHFIHAFPHNSCRPLLQPQATFGKSENAAASERAAVAEAVERYSIVFRGDEPTVLAKCGELDTVRPQDLLLFSGAQYAARDRWNTLHNEYHWVPEAFCDHQAVHWTMARDLGAESSRYLPTAYCYMWYPFGETARFCAADTNGCAAGATIGEALLSAFLELVERDAVAIWWYNRLRRPAVELSSFHDLELLKMYDALAKAGREIHLLDITNDLCIPTYVAVAPKRDGTQPVFGCAAHVSPIAAARRAISEAIQIWFWVDKQPHNDDLTDFLTEANLNKQTYLAPLGSSRALQEPGLRVEDALQYCLDRCRASGLNPLWINMSRRDAGLPVVRVVVPGLRHFWPRFAAGRLYSVPVELGWLSGPTSETDLNPLPCMI